MGDLLEFSTRVENDEPSIHDQRERALRDAEVWSNRIDLAREAYGTAVDRCAELGLSQTVIARRVGKTEAAIRMLLKRRKK